MDKLQLLNDHPLPFAKVLGLKFVAASTVDRFPICAAVRKGDGDLKAALDNPFWAWRPSAQAFGQFAADCFRQPWTLDVRRIVLDVRERLRVAAPGLKT